MFLRASLLIVMLGAVACGPGRVQTAPLPDEQSRKPVAPTIAKHEVIAAPDGISVDSLRQLNERAGKPSFGVIGAYYQLPLARPAGAAYTSGQIAGIPYDQTRVVPEASRPWAVRPTPAAEAEMLQTTVAALLDAGITLKEVSMADAAKIMAAEQNAADSNSVASFNQLTPSGVELLISLQTGEGLAGALYVGRVIRTSDGALLALASRPNVGAVSLRPLVHSLVMQSLQRLAQQP
ncbi:MAG: hypothetical protein ABIJ09_01655 [Pseudomonadota bacterium]